MYFYIKEKCNYIIVRKMQKREKTNTFTIQRLLEDSEWAQCLSGPPQPSTTWTLTTATTTIVT